MALDGVSMAKKRADKDLMRELASWAGGALSVGDERKGVLVADDVEVELHIRVRRRVVAEAAQDYRSAALRHLETKTFLVRHCGCYVVKKGGIGRRQGDCANRIVAVVVYRPGARAAAAAGHKVGADGDLGFLFVCGRHREAHGIDAENVLATVELPPSSLLEIQRLDQVARAKWDEERRVESARLDEEYRQQRAATAQRASATPAGRRVRHLIDVDPSSKPPTGKAK